MSIETDDLKRRIDRLKDRVDDLEKHVRDGEHFDEIKNRIEALERFDRKMDRFDNHDQRLDRLERITSTLSDEPDVDRMVPRHPDEPDILNELGSIGMKYGLPVCAKAADEINRLRAELDALLAEVERLRKERDEARADSDYIAAAIDKLQGERDDAVARLAAVVLATKGIS